MHVFGRWEDPQRTHREPTQTRDEHANSTQNSRIVLGPGIELTTCCDYEAGARTTVLLCRTLNNLLPEEKKLLFSFPHLMCITDCVTLLEKKSTVRAPALMDLRGWWSCWG